MAAVKILPNFLKHSLERVLPTSLQTLQRDYNNIFNPAETIVENGNEKNNKHDNNNDAKMTRGMEVNDNNNNNTITYGRKESTAYTAFRFAPIYNVQEYVYNELKERLPHFKPKQVLDFGAGPGQTHWAVNQVFDENGAFYDYDDDDDTKTKNVNNSNNNVKPIQYTYIEESMAMQDIGKELCKPIKHLSKSITWQHSIRDVFEKEHEQNKKYDMAVISYTLSDLPTQSAQNATVQLCWEKLSDDGVLVVIEEGTPFGFGIISQVRNLAIDGKENNDLDDLVKDMEDGRMKNDQITDTSNDRIDFTLDNDHADHETKHMSHSKTKNKKHKKKKRKRKNNNGIQLNDANIIAPCPHMYECPMAYYGIDPNLICRFPIRVETPYSSYYKMEYFSYLILQKKSNFETESIFQNLALDTFDIYGRAIRPPRKRKSHVILDLCTNRGDLESLTVTKKYNRIVPTLYRKSRKLPYGKLWPDLTEHQRLYEKLYGTDEVEDNEEIQALKEKGELFNVDDEMFDDLSEGEDE